MVELIVSLSITAIIMVGLSMFFASSFQNVFQAQQSLEGTQGHFVINNIIRSKFTNLEKIWEDGTDDYVIFENKPTENMLPFTYIGLDTAKLVFKDFFMFKGMYESTASSSSNIPNAAGITQVGGDYYISQPSENKIYKCNPIASCDEFITSELKQPIGLTTDNTYLFVADAGNNRIVKIDVTTGDIITPSVAQNLNFPVGIDFYNDGTTSYLFFSEPYKNKVYRVKTDGTDLKVVVGDGDNTACDNSALYCKLNFPTGVFADDATDSLYIADTGNNRVLKVSDPDPKKNTNIDFEFNFELADNYKLDKITLEGDFVDGTYNQSGSNLISDGANYISKTFTSPTSASQPTVYVSGGLCFVGATSFFVDNDLSGYNLEPGDKIIINDVAYTINTYSPDDKNCNITPLAPAPAPPPDVRDKIIVEESLSGVDSGNPIYFSNKTGEETIIKIDGIKFDNEGFQKIDIKTFEVGDAIEKETDSKSFRIGNGILGTTEDTIAVLVGVYTYPTGLSMDSGLQVGDGVAFNTTGATFDYTTDFTIDDLKFEQLNTNKILQATVTADGKEYIINGALP